jgi:hypothetical protein
MSGGNLWGQPYLTSESHAILNDLQQSHVPFFEGRRTRYFSTSHILLPRKRVNEIDDLTHYRQSD